MQRIITDEYKEFSEKYQFTPAVKKGNMIFTSAIFGSVFKNAPSFLKQADYYESHLSKMGKILIGRGPVNQAKIICFHLEEILKGADANLSDIVRLNISFMHKVKKSELIPALQIIKSKFKDAIPTYELGRMDFPALKGVLLQVSATAIV